MRWRIRAGGVGSALIQLTKRRGATIEPHIFQSLIRYIENGDVRPMLAHSFPLSQLHAAQHAFIDKKHVGNIVVTME
jgi:NADPH:quinone reductase-like Zn-dependent oxidoreductase